MYINHSMADIANITLFLNTVLQVSVFILRSKITVQQQQCLQKLDCIIQCCKDCTKKAQVWYN